MGVLGSGDGCFWDDAHVRAVSRVILDLVFRIYLAWEDILAIPPFSYIA